MCAVWRTGSQCQNIYDSMLIPVGEKIESSLQSYTSQDKVYACTLTVRLWRWKTIRQACSLPSLLQSPHNTTALLVAGSSVSHSITII